MTRIHSSASPTQFHSPSRVWRSVAAVLFSLLLAPTAAFADEPANHAAPAATAAAP
ncbi:hypothetical protein PF70_00008, partial [Pseudomonas asplenii]